MLSAEEETSLEAVLIVPYTSSINSAKSLGESSTAPGRACRQTTKIEAGHFRIVVVQNVCKNGTGYITWDRVRLLAHWLERLTDVAP